MHTVHVNTPTRWLETSATDLTTNHEDSKCHGDPRASLSGA